MSRFLLLNCERTSCHVVAADASRQGVEVAGSAVFNLDEQLTPANAEAQGKKLRDFLKANGLPAAPVLACIGRDRVVLKEINHPTVPPQEEPALIRFQATKDLADPTEQVVVDYLPLSDADATGERRALAVILRRDVLVSMQQLCRAAGLKLLALVPRPFAMAGCLQLARQRQPSLAASFADNAAVVLLNCRWAELNVLQASKLIFSRSLGAGPTLAAEVRRNLTVLANQTRGGLARSGPRVLYLVGATPEQPFQGLDLPVLALDLFTESELAKIALDNRSGLAACLGLAHAWARKEVAINLVNPREPAPVTDTGRRNRLLRWAGAAVLLLVAWMGGQMLLAREREKIQELTEAKAQTEANFKRLEQDRVDLEALKEWDQGAIPWIDELYDIAARFPRVTGLRLTKIQIEPIARRTAKDKFAARMVLNGVVPAGKEGLLKQFTDSMRDPHLQIRDNRLRGQSFTIAVDVARQSAREYQTKWPASYEPLWKGSQR